MKYPICRFIAFLGASLLMPSAGAEVLQPGQRLSVVITENQPDGEAHRQHYLTNAFPLVQAAGMKEITIFKVEKVLVGQGAPEGAGLYFWPSKEAAQQSHTNPKYVNELKPLRSKSWKEMKSVDMEIKEPLEITLDKSKAHTIALLWLKDRAAYDRYYEGTKALRKKLGAKTLLTLSSERYENLTQGETTPPNKVVLLQWDSVESINAYDKAPEFVAHLEDFQQAVTGIEWYQLGFWD